MLFGKRRVDEDEKARYAAMAKARAEEEAANRKIIEETQARKEAERKALYKRQADYQDNVDVFSGGGGSKMRQPSGTVNREMLENAQKTSSPALMAEEALAAALADVGNLEPRVAIDMLNFQIGEARAAGVQSYSMNLKKALSLLSTLELARDDPNAGASDLDEDAAAVNDKLDVLFGSGYLEPSDDGVEFEPL